MPSRNSNTGRSKRVKSKIVKVVITPEKAPKKKLEVNVNESSSPEDILHASWEFISAFQFFNTFKAYFHLSKNLSIEQLENALLAKKDDLQQQQQQNDEVQDDASMHLKRESSVFSQQSNQSGTPQPMRNYLANFMVHILSPLLTQRQKGLINNDNYEDYIAQVFPEYTNFSEMSILDKIKVLKSIELAHVEIAHPDLLALQSNKSSEALRISPLGSDYAGWVYWYFGDNRLYREIPLPTGKKGASIADTLEFTFELVCSTIDEWKDTLKKFQSSKRLANKELTSAINTLGLEVIANLEAKEEARLRQEAKIKKAREMELIPKKRSRRLEAKFDEQAKRQKVLDEAREQAEMEELERKRQEKEAKLIADQERKEVQTEETRLRKEIHNYLTDLVVQGQESEADMKHLRTPFGLKSSPEERLEKMQGWIKLLKGAVSIELTEQGTIQFVGESLDAALDSILFKNTMRIFLVTLLRYKLDPASVAYKKIEDVHKKLVLNRYNSIDSFSQDLNTAIESITENVVRHDAIHLFTAIFSLAPSLMDKQELDNTISNDLNDSNSILDAVSDTNTTTPAITTTPTSAQILPEKAIEKTTADLQTLDFTSSSTPNDTITTFTTTTTPSQTSPEKPVEVTTDLEIIDPTTSLDISNIATNTDPLLQTSIEIPVKTNTDLQAQNPSTSVSELSSLSVVETSNV